MQENSISKILETKCELKQNLYYLFKISILKNCK